MLYEPAHAHTSQSVLIFVNSAVFVKCFFFFSPSCMCEIKSSSGGFSYISVVWESVGAWVVPPWWALASAPGWAAPEEAGKNGNLQAPREEPQTRPHRWTSSLVLKRDTERQSERERLTDSLMSEVLSLSAQQVTILKKKKAYHTKYKKVFILQNWFALFLDCDKLVGDLSLLLKGYQGSNSVKSDPSDIKDVISSTVGHFA